MMLHVVKKSKTCISIAVLVIILVVAVNVAVFQKYSGQESTLQLVQVFFRHGERTIAFERTYAKDPYLNHTYYPYGKGQLTLDGKRTMYKVGKQLRERYGDFLGSTYKNNLIYATASFYKRTKMSMQSVLAGLFPPTPTYMLEDNLNWQPVDYDYLHKDQDDMLAFWGKCKEYYTGICNELFSTDYVKNIDREYQHVYEYASEHTGEQLDSLYKIGWYYAILKCQEEYGLKLPEWTKKVYPEPLHTLAKEMWMSHVATFTGIKYAAGKILETIHKNALQKIQKNEANEEDIKMYLYAGHDYGIIGILAALNIEHDYKVPYGAHIIVEMHKIHNEYIYKVYYQDYSSYSLDVRTIRNCSDFCPIDNFKELTQQYYPTLDMCI